MVLQQTKKLLQSKRNIQRNDRRQRMGENYGTLYNKQGTNIQHLERASEAQQQQNSKTNYAVKNWVKDMSSYRKKTFSWLVVK